jgi:Domain of unknown function (DUF4274)
MARQYPAPRFEDYMVPRKREILFDWLFAHSSDEWHGMAADWNWDAGFDILGWMISQPECNRATALLIFERAAPHDFFSKWPGVRERYLTNEKGTYYLCREIIGRWKAGFYTRSEVKLGEEDASSFDQEKARYETAISEFPGDRDGMELPADFNPPATGRVISRTSFAEGVPKELVEQVWAAEQGSHR